MVLQSDSIIPADNNIIDIALFMDGELPAGASNQHSNVYKIYQTFLKQNPHCHTLYVESPYNNQAWPLWKRSVINWMNANIDWTLDETLSNMMSVFERAVSQLRNDPTKKLRCHFVGAHIGGSLIRHIAAQLFVKYIQRTDLEFIHRCEFNYILFDCTDIVIGFDKSLVRKWREDVWDNERPIFNFHLPLGTTTNTVQHYIGFYQKNERYPMLIDRQNFAPLHINEIWTGHEPIGVLTSRSILKNALQTLQNSGVIISADAALPRRDASRHYPVSTTGWRYPICAKAGHYRSDIVPTIAVDTFEGDLPDFRRPDYHRLQLNQRGSTSILQRYPTDMLNQALPMYAPAFEDPARNTNATHKKSSRHRHTQPAKAEHTNARSRLG